MRIPVAPSLLFALLVACSGGTEAPNPPRDGGASIQDGGEAPRDGGEAPRDGGVDVDAGFEPTAHAIVDIAQPMIDEGWYPSLSVAWLDDGEVHHLGLGTVGAGGPTPDADTLYEIGSITKTFTGTLLGDMASRGEVMITDTAQSAAWPSLTLPVFDTTEIRLVDLATHFSALPRLPDNFAPADPANPYVDYTRDDLDAFFANHTLARRPGQTFDYSNLGVALLGQLLANTASTAYDQLLAERVLDPLGMMDTTFDLDAEQQTRLAPGYDYNGEPTSNWDLGIFDPAGGLESSASDMMLYARAYLDRTTLGDAMNLATTAQANIDAQTSVGLNWILANGGELVLHDGATGGYNALLVLVPSEDRAVLVLANGASYRTNELGFAIVQAVRGQAYVRPDPMPTVDVSDEALDRNVGVYALQGNAALQATVTRVGDALWVQLTDQPNLKLFATSDRDFYIRAVEAALTFDAPDGAGEVAGFTLRQGGGTPRFDRIP